MRVKKILCAAVSAAFCCSFLTANVTADEFDVSNSSEIVVSAENEAADETFFPLAHFQTAIGWKMLKMLCS